MISAVLKWVFDPAMFAGLVIALALGFAGGFVTGHQVGADGVSVHVAAGAIADAAANEAEVGQLNAEAITADQTAAASKAKLAADLNAARAQIRAMTDGTAPVVSKALVDAINRGIE